VGDEDAGSGLSLMSFVSAPHRGDRVCWIISPHPEEIFYFSSVPMEAAPPFRNILSLMGRRQVFTFFASEDPCPVTFFLPEGLSFFTFPHPSALFLCLPLEDGVRIRAFANSAAWFVSSRAPLFLRWRSRPLRFHY